MTSSPLPLPPPPTASGRGTVPVRLSCIGLALAVSGCAPAVSSSVTAPAATVTASAAAPSGVVEYTVWDDPRITESSDLAYTDGTLLTTNDADDPAVIYASVGTDGSITGTLTYAPTDPVDVEAITADPDGTVWVGDIGDNLESRESIAVFRIDTASWSGDTSTTAERITLRYPDGPHNAEALLVSPLTGEMFVVTKSSQATRVYSAGVPTTDDITLTRVTTPTLITTVSDGSFNPAGDQIWLRNGEDVAVYSAQTWQPLAEATLPDQPKGEGLCPGPDGTWLTSSEGVGTPVWQWTLNL